MTYSEALKVFSDSYDFLKQFNVICEKIKSLQEGRQRLTQLYGAEKVKSSHVYQNPAQIALEQQDEERERLNAIMADGVNAMTRASELSRLVEDPFGSVLNLHYCLGWSLPRIARSYNKSLATIKRWKNEGLNRLRKALENTPVAP